MINISQPFHRTSAGPIDDSLGLSIAEMKTVNDNLMPSKYFTICQDDGYIYLYDKSNTVDVTTGKFRKFEVPTSVSELANDSGFIDKTVNDLTNYYLSTNTYTRTEVDNLIAAAKNGRFIYVSTLPTEDIDTKAIYLVPKSEGSETTNIKDEYINIDGTAAGWEKIGDTKIDLSDYVTNASLETILADYVSDAELEAILADYVTDTSLNTTLADYVTDTDLDTALSGYVETTELADYVEKSSTEGLLKNDGTVDTTQYISDVSGKQDKIQFDTLPTADAEHAGMIVQFTGTTGTYTNGFYYECVEDEGIYSWEQRDVQPVHSTVAELDDLTDVDLTSPTDGQTLVYDAETNKFVNGDILVEINELGDIDDVDLNNLESGQTIMWDAASSKWVNGSASGALGTAITSSVSAGGIPSGKTYAVGTSYDALWKDLLNPVAYPTLTNPSATLSATGAKLLETGATLATTMTVSFSRGSISPAYGTSGYRSGAATDYALNGGTAQSSNSFSVTVDSSQLTYQATVNYAAGEQPKDSEGGNYSSALPAGSVNSNTITYEFVDAIWANTANITTVAKLALVSKSAKVKELSFGAQTVANPEVFDVPASWTVTAVEVLNTLSNQWENCASEFTVTDTTHDDASGTSVAYKRYTDNRGYQAGARKVRFKWS